MLALCGADLESQACLAEERQGVVWLRRTVPLDRGHVFILVPLDGDLHAPEVEAIGSAEVVVDVLTLVVCVAEVQGRFGCPEGSSGPGNLDRSADALEVLLFGPASVRLHLGRVTGSLAD